MIYRTLGAKVIKKNDFQYIKYVFSYFCTIILQIIELIIQNLQHSYHEFCLFVRRAKHQLHTDGRWQSRRVQHPQGHHRRDLQGRRQLPSPVNRPGQTRHPPTQLTKS